MDRKGFAPIAIALIIVAGILVLGGAFYAYHRYSEEHSTSVIPPGLYDPIPPIVATSTPSSSSPITSYRSYLAPASGPVGTVVTIHGSGFAPTGNQVTLDGMVAGSLDGLPSPDGKTLTFTMPHSLGPNCKPDQACPMYMRVITDGSYTVAVISNGATYNIGTFTITGGGGPRTTP